MTDERTDSAAHRTGGRPAAARASRRRPALLLAGAVLLLLLAGLAWRLLSGDTSRNGAPLAMYWTTTAETREARVDGSHVLIGPATRLSVSDGRGMRLSGVARFDIPADEDAPFTLIAEDVIVRTTGASFAVDAAALDVRVAVRDGTVEVMPLGLPPVVLNAGDRLIVSETGMQPERGVSLETDLAWTERRLVFENAPLRRVATELERWYGVRLFVAEELRDRTVTATFAGESLDQLVARLAFLVGARARRTDGSVVLEPAEPVTGTTALAAP